MDQSLTRRNGIDRNFYPGRVSKKPLNRPKRSGRAPLHPNGRGRLVDRRTSRGSLEM